ncbi:hypothetical protein TcCL_Unassigned00071 [Trypanosoma cruzi]|nr:hypothetical protein TcCL_Unassigned00071 [Trypanosoma cruzi]
MAPKDNRGCFVRQSRRRWAWHSHGGAVSAPCSRTATPVGEAAEAQRARSNATCNLPQHRHIIVLLFCSRCLSVCTITDTKNKCTPLQKGRNKEKRRRDPTVPPRAHTLLHPPPLPRRGPQSHRRAKTTMCTTPSYTER